MLPIDVKNVFYVFYYFYKKAFFKVFFYFFEYFLLSRANIFLAYKTCQNPTKPAEPLHKQLLSDGFNMAAIKKFPQTLSCILR